MTRLRHTIAAATLVALALAACTGGDDASTSTTTTGVAVAPTTLPPPPSTTPIDGARLIADTIADPTADVNAVAVNGGDAARYVELRRTSARLFGDELTSRPLGDAAQLCAGEGCALLADPVIDGRLVSSLSIDGRPLAGRISGIGSLAEADGVVARVRVAYVTNAGQLVIALVATNTTDVEIELFGFAGVYQPAVGGAGVEAAGAWGDAQIASGASGTLLLVFDTTVLGGRLALRGLLGDGLDIALDIAVPAA